MMSNKKGFVLIFVFVVLVGLSGVLLAFLSMVASELKITGTELRDKQVFLIAEAGRAKARWALTVGGEDVGWGESDTELGRGTYTVTTAEGSDPQHATITSTGYIPDDTDYIARRKVVEKDIPLSGGGAGENLAEGMDISASSGKNPDKANDGKLNTNWQSANGGSAWLRIDFTEATDIGQVVFHEDGSNIGDYTVEYSPDDAVWTVVPDLEKVGSTANFTSTSARYFRFRVTSLLPGSMDVTIAELEMYEGGIGHGTFSTSW